jgi:phosphoglycerate dehydrogenase-like enzyme
MLSRVSGFNRSPIFLCTRRLSSKLNIAVLCQPNNPALRNLPLSNDVNFMIGYNDADFAKYRDISQSKAVVVIQPADMSIIDALWTKHFENVIWVHSFYAGVDSMSLFIRERLKQKNDIVLTNGKGAFSSSLGEYIMAASLHFNKQICHLQDNKTKKKWEKFIMPVLKNKTIGFIGFGNIAKSAARIAKVGFGMNVAVFRRHPEKTYEDVNAQSLVDCSYSDSHDVFANSDIVVCTLPGTPDTYKFCSSSHFSIMKNNAIFISCGR